VMTIQTGEGEGSEKTNAKNLGCHRKYQGRGDR